MKKSTLLVLGLVFILFISGMLSACTGSWSDEAVASGGGRRGTPRHTQMMTPMSTRTPMLTRTAQATPMATHTPQQTRMMTRTPQATCTLQSTRQSTPMRTPMKTPMMTPWWK